MRPCLSKQFLDGGKRGTSVGEGPSPLLPYLAYIIAPRGAAHTYFHLKSLHFNPSTSSSTSSTSYIPKSFELLENMKYVKYVKN
jgi:hypothetical protein